MRLPEDTVEENELSASVPRHIKLSSLPLPFDTRVIPCRRFAPQRDSGDVIMILSKDVAHRNITRDCSNCIAAVTEGDEVDLKLVSNRSLRVNLPMEVMYSGCFALSGTSISSNIMALLFLLFIFFAAMSVGDGMGEE